MKIGIDGSGAMGTQTGVGKYINRLIENLSLIDTSNEYLVYLNYFRTGKINPFGNGYQITKNRIPAKIQRLLHNQLKIPIETFVGNIDIFHGPNYFVPPSKQSKKVVTVHDLTFEFFPETMIGRDAAYYKKYVPMSMQKADHILTISNSSKKDLIERFKVPADKISVTYMAAGSNFAPISNKDVIKPVLKKYKLPSNFLLTVCTLEPRKNLVTLVKAMSALRKNKKNEQKLIVVGGSGWKNDELFKQISELGLENDIIFPGYIGQEDLPALYNACSLFLFPSLYEGFGIPPLEALSCGTACICSNSSSLPEVVGDGAILIDPVNADEWVEQIEFLLDNPSKIDELGKRGMEQAKKFSWGKTAQETLAVYKKIAD